MDRVVDQPPPQGSEGIESHLTIVHQGEDEPVGSLLVPTDFAEESTYALTHAVRIAQQMRHRVVLLHVLEKHGPSEQEARQKMLQQIEEAEPEVEVATLIAEGVVREKVPAIAEQLNAEYIILGSHDVKIPQHYKLSTSVKLLLVGNIPYITIQNPPRIDSYEDIVFPIDFTDENQEKYEWLERLCHYHMPTFHLLRPFLNEPELLARVDMNIAKAMSILSRRGTRHTVRVVPGKYDYALEILQVARELEAGLVVVTTSFDPRKEGIYMLDPHERTLLMQASDIPIMSVNPKR